MEASEVERLDRICHALSDGTRRRLLEHLGQRPGATTADLTRQVRGLTRWTVMKHLAVLREVRLVQTLPDGRRRRHYRDVRALSLLRRWLDAHGV